MPLKTLWSFIKIILKNHIHFLESDTTLSSNNPLRFRKNITITEKIKTIDNKIEQNKAQYDLDRQIGKISALSSWHVSKYEILTGKHVLPEKDLLEKAATMKIFEYSLLGSELRKQTSVPEKQYQKFDKVFESNKNKKKLC